MYGVTVVPSDVSFTRLELGNLFDTNLLSVENPSFWLDGYQYLGLVTSLNESQALGPPFGVRLLNRGSFDVVTTSHWIDFCRRNHSVACLPTDLIGISSFRVIDCLTQIVVDAPQSCQYVALSYVWGQNRAPAQDDKKDRPSVQGSPKVIAHSMEVVRLLGWRYLWVDRYCINQSDIHDRHDQIRRMDSIYASAQLTIIAAEGDDPDLGLPGVNGLLRKPQPVCRIGEHTVASSLTPATASLEKTAWASRGWTYQEGLLSKRRLMFRFDQVHFECNGMHCAEVVHLPLEAMHNKETRKAKIEIPLGAFEEKNVGDSPWKIMNYVSKFTRRKLSYQSDALNAIQGIFRVFEKSPYPLFQLMGIPIMPPFILPPFVVPVSSSLDPLIMIERSPEDGFMIGLLWHRSHFHFGACVRRPDFPSWTWAGWKGQTESYLEFDSRSTLCDLRAQVAIELTDGSLLPFPREHSSLPRYLTTIQGTKYIHVTAKTAVCEIMSRHNLVWQQHKRPSKTPYMALIEGTSRSICLQFSPGDLFAGEPSERSQVLGMRFTAIIFAPITDDAFLDWQVSVLVVEERGDFAERVGICLRAEFADMRGMTTQPIISDFGNSPDFRNVSFTDEERQQNKREFKDWFDELSTRTIRIG